MASSIGHIRFNGMASGLDVDQLVSDLMKSESLPLDKIRRQKQSIVWKREAYQSMNTALLSFRNTLKDLRFESSFNVKKATSSATNVLDVSSVSSSATNASMTINVKELASSATLIGDRVTADPNAAVNVSGEFKVKGSKGEVGITITAGTSTVNSIISDINAKSAITGVKANFNETSGQIFLAASDSGEISEVTITDVAKPDGTTTNAFKTIFNMGTMSAKGNDAVYTINNSGNIYSSTNQINISGINISLKSQGTSLISASSDTSKIEEKIKEFVKTYNELVTVLNGTTTEKPNRNYTALTDSEKESMSEKQIELWEQKAKLGVLYRDSTLQSTINSMRSGLNTSVAGIASGTKDFAAMDMLSEIGITVVNDYKENGKLQIDETKLKEALNTKLDDVIKMFTKTSSSKQDTAQGLATYREESGFGERLYSIVNESMSKISKIIGSSSSMEAIDDSVIGKQLNNIKQQEDSWVDRLLTIENRYYKKFTAMEKAIQNMNNQSSWLGQQMT